MDRDLLTPDWIGPVEGVPAEAVHRLFEAHARERPEALAVVGADGASLTYGELERRANRLARRLRGLGVGPDTVVALCLSRSPELVLASVGVLKAGGAYLPIDPASPAERLAYTLADSGALALLTSAQIAASLPDAPLPVLVLDADPFPEESGEPVEPLFFDPDLLSYVIYTSGSTGRPKGTELRHAGLSSLIAWHLRTYGIRPEDRLSMAAGPGFDASVWEVWYCLAAGASLHVVPPGILVSPPDLLAWLAERRIDVCFLPTPLADALTAETGETAERRPAGLVMRTLLTGGDRLLRRPDPDCPYVLYNHYGPTETTIVNTWSAVDPAGEGLPDLGRPLANVQIHLVDPELDRVPAGEPGEVLIGGAGLGRGYLRRPDLTAERFIPDPFGAPGGRLYRTGDLARRLPNGCIGFLGRIDHQVKIRGIRIELGEVETALIAHPDVREAAAVVREDAPADRRGDRRGDRRLVAYVVGKDGPPDLSSLRGFLAGRLPQAMVPSAFVVLDALPKNVNGKVDRLALPAPGRERQGAEESYVAPRNEAEARLAALWAEVLGLDRVGAEDPFLEIGGHSLMATRIASRVRDAFGVELPPGALFEAPTVAALAALVRELRPEAGETRILPIIGTGRTGRTGDMPASFAQERLWFLDQLAPGSPLYNIAGGVRVTGWLDVPAFARALEEVVRRHEALRTTLPATDGRPVQRISPVSPLVRLELPEIDLRALPTLPAILRQAEQRRLAREESRWPFDLARGPLLRATLLRTGEAYEVLFTVHHTVADGWSMDVLVQELGALYRAFASRQLSPLPPLPIQYADFAVWQRAWLQGETLERQLAWWRRELTGAPALTELPSDRARPAVQSYRGRLWRSAFAADLAAALEALARREGASLFMVLLAGLFALLHRTAEAPEDLVVGSPVANRNRSETEGLIGFFANTLALRARPSAGQSFRGLLARVRATALGAYAHQDVPFERLVEELQVPRSLGHNPLFQVLLVLQNATTRRLELPGATLEPLEPWSETAKLDMALSFEEALGQETGGLELTVEYATDLFEEATVARLLEHLRTVLEAAVAEPDLPLSALAFLAAPERQQVVAAQAADGPVSRERRVSALRAALSGLRRAVLARLVRAALDRALRRSGGSGGKGIPHRAGGGPAPLSFAQKRLWFLDRLEPGGSSYNVPAVLRLAGRLDVAALAAALAAVVRRHETLRTVFEERDGEPVQVVGPPFAPALPVVDLRAVPEDRRQAEALLRLTAEAERPFDLARGPLIRAGLVRLEDEAWILLVNLHHVVSDGWSVGVLVRESAELYAALVERRAPLLPELPELPVQYADFALWQRERLRGEALESLLGYWRQALAGAPALLELPTDRPRPPVQSYRGGVEPVSLPAAVAAPLAALARRSGSTLFMATLAGLQALFHRYTGQEDVLVGTPVANRTRVELEGLIGFFVNTLVLRGRISGGLGFRALLEQVREAALGAYAHQDLPFEKLVEDLGGARSLAYSPLFQVMLAWQNTPAEPLAMPGLTLEPLPFHLGTSIFDLTLSLWETAWESAEGASESIEGIDGEIEYAAALFDPPTVRRMLGHLRVLVAAAAADPDRPIAELPLLSEAERSELAAWNRTAEAYPDACLHELIEAQVARTPDAVAVAFEGETLTYRELDAWASVLATELPATLIGISVERSLEMVVGLVAILKAGGAYVPLDPSYPAERLAFMLEDAAVPVLLTQAHLVRERERDPKDGKDRKDDRNPERAAYMIYTSGSTGRPKGALNTHRGIVNRILWMQREYGLTPEDRVLQKTPFSFDVSVWEFFWPLIVGARLVVARPGGHQDPAYLVETIRREEITTIHFVPSMLQVFVEQPGVEQCVSLRRVMASGEALPAELAKRFFARLPDGVELHNLYGPTEAAVDVTYHFCHPGEERVPIGRPVANTRIHILDRGGQEVPVGIPGELLIAGVQVGQGYLGRPDLTAERFVPDEGGARMYRTGDLARWLPDGEVEYLGRIDHQVKIRGFRIELGEIEAALVRHCEVREAVVLVRDQSLVACVVSSRRGGEGLRAVLAESLPEHMLPSSFVFLDAMPLTPNGKVDRKALAAIEPQCGESAFIAPRNAAEEILAGIWRGLLGVSRVGMTDSFFELGGHSLLAMRLVARVRDAFGVELPLRAVFEAPTVEGLAARIGTVSGRGDAPPPIRRAPRDVDLPLSFAQERLWFLDRLQPDSPFYNISTALRLRGALNVPVLEAAFAEIVRRHEALRTTFPESGGVPVQRIAPASGLALPVVDLSGAPETEIRRLVAEIASLPFDLERGPLLRLALLRLGEDDWVLLFAMHHIVSDGWSLGVLIEEGGALYRAFREGRPSPLPPLAVQYADFAAWQRAWLRGDVLDRQLAWWKAELAGAPTRLELPTDRPRPRVQTFRGGVRKVALASALTASLKDLAAREGATLFMVLLASFQALLQRYSGQDDLLVGSPIAGRSRTELEPLIGFFVNTLVLRGRPAGERPFAELLARVRSSTLGAFAHAEIPFERLVEELEVERSLAWSPLVQVAFALQNVPGGAPELPGLELSPVDVEWTAAKFDLSLVLTEQPGDGITGMEGTLEYATGLFDVGTVDRLAGHLRTLLEGVAAGGSGPLADLPILSTAEARQVVVDWNRTRTDFPRGACIHELFDEQAERAPDAVAAVFGAEVCTYRDLQARANRLAHHLIRLGVRPGAPVGISLERSLDMVVATLAVLKAGGAYVPLDTTYPEDRLAFMLEDSGARVVIRSADCDPKLLEALSDRSPKVFAAPESLAYLVYTSGSTGVPKGVAVPHRAVVRLVRNTDYIDIRPDDVPAQASNTSFDAATFEIWGALLNGARMVGVSKETLLSPRELAEQIRRDGITALFLTTAVFNQIGREEPGAFRPLRHLLFGGEAVDPARVRQVLEDGGSERLLHVYGPTESTTFASWHLVEEVPDGAATVPIGMPLANTILLVLDRALHSVPPGVPGELCIGGDGLAWGYLNRPDLTAERFVPDPFSAEGGRLYRTGDLVRRRAGDGAVEFLGRTDFQVKIRGFRIEPGEIEAALLAHPGVRDAVVLVLGEGNDKRLAAYVAGAAPAADLKAHLAARLPSFMVPPGWVVLDSLPLNPNGKVDRKALARIEPESEEQLAGTAFEPPRTLTEELLAGAWSEVLGVERVGAGDDFFELGGHSLLATRLVSRVRDLFQVELPLRALFETSVLSGLAERIDLLRQDGSGPPPPILRGGQTEGPLSFAQERLWFLERLDPGTPFYNVPFALRMIGDRGDLDVMILAAAFRQIVHRHEALRTTFGWLDGRPWQKVSPPGDLPLPEIDLTGLPLDRRETEAARRLRDEAFRPFDLERGPLLRVLLVRLGAEERWAFLNVHHLVSDGWSIGVLVRELGALYSGDLGAALPELPIQYLDFAAWQRAWLGDEALQSHIRYWRERLRGARTVLELPTDRPRPPVQTFRGTVRPLELPARLVRDLGTLGRRRGATLFMTLLAAWQTVLYRYTGQDDLLVGSPVAGRGRRELEGLIGLFVNTVVLRGELSPEDGELTFGELLERTRTAALGAFAHQDLPFERLVDELRVERSLARHPVFQVVLALNNTPWQGLSLPGVTLEPLAVESGTTKVDLLLALSEGPAGLAGGWEYSTDLFDASTIDRMTGHLRTLLEGAAAEPARRLSDLPLLAGPERHQVLVEWNDTVEGTEPVEPVRLDQLFEAAAARFPDHDAVVFGDRRVTYAGLAAQAEGLAERLRSLGVGPEERVAICAGEGIERIVAVLAVFRAGGAYLPLDPSHPTERLAWMLEDARVRVLLVEPGLLEILPETGAAVMGLGPHSPAPSPAPPFTPSPGEGETSEPLSWACGGAPLPGRVCLGGAGEGAGVRASHLAYIIYTSGSTGRPNGVPVEHRSAAHLIRQAVRHFQVDAASRVLQSVSFSFDASVLETWMALSTGATLVLCRREARMSGPALADLIRGEAITHAVLTPSVLGILPEDGLPTLRTVSVGGDNCPAELATRWSPPQRALRLLNCYGPTETTIFAVLAECRGPFRREPPIGRPLGNTRAFVLDPAGRPVPAGVPGELWLGGEGLARGYLNRPDLTADRFRPDPFAVPGEERGDEGARLYRTGDLVRLLTDGEMEFLGRADGQVKIRGLRIELGEVEAALGRHPAVAECAVLALGQGADRRLAAFVVARPQGEGALVSQLREHLRLTLPDYMVPASFLFLETMPLTPVGKVDRRTLASRAGMDLAVDGEAGRVEARDVLELELARIWEEVLGQPGIGVRDNFFELGGHSLLAVRLLARVQERFGRDLPLAVLFQEGTVEQMAALLRAEVGQTASCLIPIQPGGSSPPFFCVHPAGGDVLCYAALARCLGPDQPFYGLQSRGLSGAGEPVADVPGMAALYLEEVRRVQPEGPYRIGGWSLGGVVAFEMARQLRERDEEAVLVLLDSAPEMAPGESEEPEDDVELLLDIVAYVANLWGDRGRDLRLSRADLEPLDAGARLDRVLDLLRGADVLPPGAGLEQLRRTLAVYRANMRAVRSYHPQPCPGGAVLFRAAEAEPSGSPQAGWDRLLAGPLEVETVPGHHLSLLAEPNVQILAKRLRHCLNEADLKEVAV